MLWHQRPADIGHDDQHDQKKHVYSGFRGFAPKEVKHRCKEHEQSKPDSRHGCQPGVDACDYGQDQSQCAQDFGDADGLSKSSRHVLDPGKKIPRLLITKDLDHARDKKYRPLTR